MKALASAAFVACAFAITSDPAAAAPAMNFAWNDCTDGAAAASDKTFACDSNSGLDVAVVSFIAPEGVTQFMGIAAFFTIRQDPPGSLVPWWQIKGASACRNGAVTVSGDFSGYSACDAGSWQSPPIGGLGPQSIDYPVPGMTTFGVVLGVPLAQVVPLQAEVHYYGCRLVISHAKSVGPGSCGGCDRGMCVVLDRIRLDQPAAAGGSIPIGVPAGQMLLQYQAPSIYTCYFLADPAKRSTWGSVKALYR